jgi:hypothetical protein
MNKKQLTLVILAMVLLAMLLPGLAMAQEPVTGPPNFIFVNFIGQEMAFDLDDTTHLIPGTDTAPDGGRLELTLSPGEHKYAANIPGRTGSAGEFTLPPGGVVAKAARFEMTSPRVEQGILIEGPKEYVFVFDFDPNAAPAESPAVIDTWQPAPAAPGQGSLVWVNYQGDELNIDMGGQLYKVPPPANTIPGRLQLEVAPGPHDYPIRVPSGSFNGQIVVSPGQVMGLSVTADLPESPKYDVGESFDATPPVTLHVYPEDLTAPAVPVEATSVITPTTAVTPTAETPTAAVTPTAEAPRLNRPGSGGDGLVGHKLHWRYPDFSSTTRLTPSPPTANSASRCRRAITLTPPACLPSPPPARSRWARRRAWR